MISIAHPSAVYILDLFYLTNCSLRKKRRAEKRRAEKGKRSKWGGRKDGRKEGGRRKE